ncbi:hypothetical protein KDL01_07235 [Actinospica durhamensis]|uniref:Cell division initiation protein n=1 Tax=Actinospica durhamensis TaxID=1508375 RepID=A0A941ELE2_9ACTN|nr:hypothetical protein [Actinospica durhamensis]MBR7833050.1 hypothetical protein [Actinospica durhamensis]
MDVNAKIDELIEIVEGARAMPMSASCVINRAQVLDLLDELKRGMPEEMDRARRVLDDRESVLAEGRREAERLIERTRGERDSIINNTDISREARGAASRILDDARRDADSIRAEADEYVDQKLANFEVVLTKTLQAVGRGRDKMRGNNPMEELGRHVEEQDLVQAERKRSRDFSGTGEMPQVREGYDNRFEGNDFEGNEFEAAGFEGAAQFETERFEEGGFETTGEFTRIAFEEAERPYEPHPHAGYEEQGYAQAPQQPYYAEAQGYDSGAYEQPGYEQPGYEQPAYEQPGYDQGAVQGYGTGEFPTDAPYGQDAYGQPAAYGAPAAYGHPGQQQGPGPEYPAEETSYFDTGLIDVRQFQQQQQYR